jgi:hypothetical protein
MLRFNYTNIVKTDGDFFLEVFRFAFLEKNKSSNGNKHNSRLMINIDGASHFVAAKYPLTYKIASPYTYTIKKEIIQLNILSSNV